MESDDISEELLGYLTDTNFDEVANKSLNDDGQSSDEDNEDADAVEENDELALWWQCWQAQAVFTLQIKLGMSNGVINESVATWDVNILMRRQLDTFNT